MNTKTFEAIDKLKEVELELHRLKNALEIANKALDAPRIWVGLTDDEVKKIVGSDRYTDLLLEVVKIVEAKLKEKNT